MAGKEFLLCDYNRDADSYRSPWSNSYFPALDDGAKPPEALRVRALCSPSWAARRSDGEGALLSTTRTQALEVLANELFAAYRTQYYEGGLSSVYLWEPSLEEAEGAAAPAGGRSGAACPFAGCFLVHKGEGSGRHGGSLESGHWDSCHVVEALPEGPITHYKLSSTVSLALAARSATAPDSDAQHQGQLSLAGSLVRSATSSGATPGAAAGHVVALGRMIEEMENKLRSALDSVYFGKTRAVVAQLRASDGALALDRRESPQSSVAHLMRASTLAGGAGRAPPAGGVAMPGMGGGGMSLAGLRSVTLRKTGPPPPPADK